MTASGCFGLTILTEGSRQWTLPLSERGLTLRDLIEMEREGS